MFQESKGLNMMYRSHLALYLITQKTFIEHLLCVSQNFRSWGYNSEKYRQKSAWAYGLGYNSLIVVIFIANIIALLLVSPLLPHRPAHTQLINCQSQSLLFVSLWHLRFYICNIIILFGSASITPIPYSMWGCFIDMYTFTNNLMVGLN